MPARRFGAVALIFLMFALPGYSREPARESLPFTTIAERAYGGPQRPGSFVIRAPELSAHFWPAMNAGVDSQPAAPPVNFETRMVIAAVRGLEPVGFNVRTEEIRRVPDGLRVIARK